MKTWKSRTVKFLGAHGHNADEAQDNLLKESPWIIEFGFDKSEFIIRQLAKKS